MKNTPHHTTLKVDNDEAGISFLIVSSLMQYIVIGFILNWVHFGYTSFETT